VTAYHRQKGSSFERLVADYLKGNGFPFADRRVKSGAKDRGDIGGVHVHGQPIVFEAKNYGGRIQPGPWLKEAQIEAENDGAAIGVVVAKRRGTAKPEDQFVIMELRDLVFLLTGKIETAPEVLDTLTEA
jgi:hypothetical protein